LRVVYGVARDEGFEEFVGVAVVVVVVVAVGGGRGRKGGTGRTSTVPPCVRVALVAVVARHRCYATATSHRHHRIDAIPSRLRGRQRGHAPTFT
jgi:hypothetical protein